MPASGAFDQSTSLIPSLAKPVVVQLAADQAWRMGTTPGGPYFRIPADAPFNYHVWPGLKLYVKATTTSSTLRGIRVQ